MEYLSKIRSISEERSGLSQKTGEEWHCVDVVVDLIHENGRIYGESIKAACTDRTKYQALKPGMNGVARIWSNVNDRGYQQHKLYGFEPRVVNADREFDGGSKHSGIAADGNGEQISTPASPVETKKDDGLPF